MKKSSKEYPILRLYVGEGDRILVEKFRQLCDREGSSMSLKIRDFIRDYVRLHEPGNPQLLLERFAGEAAEPLPRYLTCRHSRKVLHRGEFYCNLEAFWRIPMGCQNCRSFRPEPSPLNVSR